MFTVPDCVHGNIALADSSELVQRLYVTSCWLGILLCLHTQSSLQVAGGLTTVLRYKLSSLAVVVAEQPNVLELAHATYST